MNSPQVTKCQIPGDMIMETVIERANSETELPPRYLRTIRKIRSWAAAAASALHKQLLWRCNSRQAHRWHRNQYGTGPWGVWAPGSYDADSVTMCYCLVRTGQDRRSLTLWFGLVWFGLTSVLTQIQGRTNLPLRQPSWASKNHVLQLNHTPDPIV